MNSWKDAIRPTRKTRSVGPHNSKPKKTTSKKKTNQKNKKSRSVTIQIPEKPRSVKIQTPEPEESRTGEDALTPQRLVSVAGHPKNCLYIDSGASLYIIFNRELLGDLIKLDRAIKIQVIDHQQNIHTVGQPTFQIAEADADPAKANPDPTGGTKALLVPNLKPSD